MYINCDEWNRICYDQKEAWNIELELEYDGLDSAPDYTSGTYKATGAKSIKTFKTEYESTNDDYLFQIDNDSITDVSDLANAILRIPMSEDNLNYDGDIYIVLEMNLSASFIVKYKFQLTNKLKDVN